MGPPKEQHPWLENIMQEGFKGYPVASIAFYGPDDEHATKVVVGIVAESDELVSMEKWYSTTGDIRSDLAVLREILEFIQNQDVKSVAMPDRIIGCPHEEGIDYPAGKPCPRCPYWVDRDRWTGE